MAAMSNARLLMTAKAFRAFGDGFTGLLLPVYLTSLGLSAFRVGVVATSDWLAQEVTRPASDHGRTG